MDVKMSENEAANDKNAAERIVCQIGKLVAYVS